MASNQTRDPRIQTFPQEYDEGIPDSTLAEFVLTHIVKFGDQLACVHAETKAKLTYNQIIHDTKALAAGLQIKLHLKEKQSVAVALPSCLDYMVTILGINLCGATGVLMNPSQTTSELKHSVSLTAPRIWIGTEAFFNNKFQEIYPDASSRPPFVFYGEKSPANSNLLLTLSDIMAIGKGKEPRKATINTKEDVALILFSSGTTGAPKGVSLTNANYIAARLQNLELTRGVDPYPEDMNVIMLPLYHTFGISSIMDNMMRGVPFVLIPQFTFQRMLESIQEFKISIMSVVPAIANELVKQPVEKYYDLSSLRLLFSGAAALSPEISEKLSEKFGCFVFQGYGMTESTLRTHGNFIGYNREGSIGVVMPFCESKIVHPETGQTLGPNEEGEICVRGPLIMKGYIGNDEATKNTIDAEGWLHTGDVGFYDEDGFFFITDRMKELIKYKGLQVSPTELEQILLAHPDVMDAAVTSIPDESAGELPRAYIVKRPDSTVKPEEIAQFLSDKVSPYKRLRGGVVFIDLIPRNATGKILRKELKNMSSKL